MNDNELKDLALDMVREVKARRMNLGTGDIHNGWRVQTNATELEAMVKDHEIVRKKYRAIVKERGGSIPQFEAIMKKVMEEN